MNALEYALLLMIYQYAEQRKDNKGKCHLYTNSISALENAFDVMNLEEGVLVEKVWDKIEDYERRC